MGSGRQFVSWIHETDFCRALDWILDHEELTGAVNVSSPHPVPNREMMATLCELCRAPFGLPATAWMLEVGAFVLRTETELIIKSRRVVPGRLLADGFPFRFPHLRDAMADLLARAPN
jgi:NAD dependent epimerase/dehydratase family enzyme